MKNTTKIKLGKRLILVCGLPGSGKTTFAKELENKFYAVRLSPDEWMTDLNINLYDSNMRQRIENLQWDFAQKIISCGGTVIIEWGTWSKSERDKLRIGAKKLGAAVELHYLSASADTLFERIQKRNMEHPPITRDTVDNWLQKIEEPTPEELTLFDHYSDSKHSNTQT